LVLTYSFNHGARIINFGIELPTLSQNYQAIYMKDLYREFIRYLSADHKVVPTGMLCIFLAACGW